MTDIYITKLENKTIISISGKDNEKFLQNLITNDITQLKSEKVIYSALLTPQGKLSNHFMIFNMEGKIYLLLDNFLKEDLISKVNLYKLKMNINIDYENNLDCIFSNISNTLNINAKISFDDPRLENMGTYLICEKSKNKIKFQDQSYYHMMLNNLGMVDGCLKNLKDKYFSLECNLKELKAISFKKGCFIGQENTARMNLKNKITKRLFKIKTHNNLNLNDNIFYQNNVVGKVVCANPAFGMFKMEKFDQYVDKPLYSEKKIKINIIKQDWMNL